MEELIADNQGHTQHAVEMQKNLVGQFAQRRADIGKWLLGSLLATNGAALIALLSHVDTMPVLMVRAAPWFLGGVLVAFASGASGWVAARHQMEYYAFKVGATVASGPPRGDELVPKKLMRDMRLWTRATAVAGATSLMAFAIGSLVVGAHFV